MLNIPEARGRLHGRPGPRTGSARSCCQGTWTPEQRSSVINGRQAKFADFSIVFEHLKKSCIVLNKKKVRGLKRLNMEETLFTWQNSSNWFCGFSQYSLRTLLYTKKITEICLQKFKLGNTRFPTVWKKFSSNPF